VNETASTVAVQKSGDARALAGLYEELRCWVLHPARQMPPQPRILGQVVLVRSGMREWMAAVSSMQSALDQTTTPVPAQASSTPTSIRAQLAAALADVVLSRIKEEAHEP